MSVNGELVQTDYLIGEILHTVIGFTPCDLQGKSRIMWNCLGVSFENPPFEVESANLDCITSCKLGCHACIEICEYTGSIPQVWFLSNRGQMTEE